MTVGQLAGLIAALALVVLVIFIAWFLVKVAGQFGMPSLVSSNSPRMLIPSAGN